MYLKYAGRVRIGDHDAGKTPAVAGEQLVQVVHVDLPGGARMQLDDPRERFSATLDGSKARHGRRRRVRAMRRMRNEEDVAVGIAATPVIRLEHFEAHQFSLRTGHRLCGDSWQPGDRLKI